MRLKGAPIGGLMKSSTLGTPDQRLFWTLRPITLEDVWI